MNSTFEKQRTGLKVFFRISVILFVIVFCCLALYIAGLFPQASVQRGLRESAHILEKEGFGPHVFNMAGSSSVVDNYTESIILSSSFFMDTKISPDAIFSNPFAMGKEDSLRKIASGNVEPSIHYTRYWQGFRSFVRPLLALSDYSMIRWLINTVFSALFAATLVILSRYLGVWHAISFAVSMIMLNLATISSNVQHSMVFFVALFSILVLMIWKKQMIRERLLYFCVVGMLTQYYDFYTAPLVTFGYPMAIMLLHNRDTQKPMSKGMHGIRLVLVCFLAWLAGYAGMWFTKMLLTSIFTPHNGFESAINSFAYRVGIKKNAYSYSVIGALIAVFRSLLQTKILAVGVGGVAVLLVSGAIYRLFTTKRWKQWLANNAALLLVSTLPLVWYALSAQPTIAHSYFQYRSLGVTVFCFLCVTFDAYSCSNQSGSLLH